MNFLRAQIHLILFKVSTQKYLDRNSIVTITTLSPIQFVHLIILLF